MKKNKGIIFFKTELETLNVFAREIEKGCLSQGIDTMWIDMSKSLLGIGKLLEYAEKYEQLAAIDFNSAKFGLKTPGGANVFESLGISCINILVDHPYWYHDRLFNMPESGTVICIDRNHMNYVSRFYKNISTTAFMPHGGCMGKKAGERNIDVLYAGSLYDSLAKIQKPDFGKWSFDAEMVCNKTIEYLLKHTDITIEAALEQMLLSVGITIADEELRIFISDCVYIERIVSSHFRKMVLEQLAKAGVKLSIYGMGWENCEFIKLPNVVYGGMISPMEVLGKMSQAKMVLNTMPWFRDGSHERVYNAMLNGAVLISERTVFLDETLPADAWIGYKATEHDIEALPEKVLATLKDEKKLAGMREAAYMYAADSETWMSRGVEICTVLIG